MVIPLHIDTAMIMSVVFDTFSSSERSTMSMHNVEMLNVVRQTVYGNLLRQCEKVDNEHKETSKHTHRFTGIVIDVSFYKYKQSHVKMWNFQTRRDD